MFSKPSPEKNAVTKWSLASSTNAYGNPLRAQKKKIANHETQKASMTYYFSGIKPQKASTHPGSIFNFTFKFKKK
jgi:hypothetical protein